MTQWIWQGLERGGVWAQGEVEAPSRAAACRQLRDAGVVAQRVTRVGFWSRRISARTLCWLIRQLATLLQAGVPLSRALACMERTPESRTVARCLSDLRRQIESGLSLSAAMRRAPRWFDAGLCQGVAAGELYGMLDQTLERLADERERRQRLQASARADLRYPLVILLLALLVMLLMLLTVVPAMQQALSGFDAPLPAATRRLIALSESLRAHAGRAGVALLLLLACARLAWRRITTWDRLLLRLPLIGPVLRHAALARWAQNLSLLCAAGVPLPAALRAAGAACANRVYCAEAIMLQAQIQTGSSLHQAVRRSLWFNPLLVQLIAVGEESGALELMLARAAHYYQQQAEQSLARFATWLEPLAMLLLGTLCGAMIWALYLPIFQLGQVVGG